MVDLTPGDISHVPHHELLVATHGLAIELMISCALPSDIASLWEPFMVKKEGNKEYRIFKGLVSLYIIKAPSPNNEDEVLVACETSAQISKSIGLADFAPSVRKFADFEEFGDSVRFIVKGAMGLSRLQGEMGNFFREKNPDFELPIGLDTEIYSRPQKFEALGFVMASPAH